MQIDLWTLVKGVALLFGIVTLVGGGYMTYSALTHEPQADTQVQATVVESHLERVDHEPGTGNADGWELYVLYRYDYGGATYKSTNFRPGPDEMFFQKKEKARSKIQDYEEGSTLTAYVDADAPNTSRLLPARTHETLFGGIFIGGIGLVFTLGFGLRYLMSGLLFGLNQIAKTGVPDPDEVAPDKYELREQFLTAFEDIEEYPIDDVETVSRDALDRSRSFESNDFEVSAVFLEDVVRDAPDEPAENADELTAYLISEMEKRGYFRQ